MLAYNGLLWLVVTVSCGVVSADIDGADFFKNSLRVDSELNCDSEVLKLYCETRCGEKHACLFGKCFCLQSKYDVKGLTPSAPKEDKSLDFDDYTDMTQALMPAETFPERPALRHHIAHFCPNLEEARKCIRTCMQLGKPAFCGKDHVCYCGHKSETPESEDKVDVQEVYGQFRDLYKKFFGEKDYHHDSHEYYYEH